MKNEINNKLNEVIYSSGDKDVIDQLKNWLKKFWNNIYMAVKGSKVDPNTIKVGQIVGMTLSDFLSDKDINYVNDQNIKGFLNKNQENTSPVTITYTPKDKAVQTYTIKGTHVYNTDGKEVFKEDSKDRRRIFANLAVQQKRAVVVSYKDKNYVVNNKEQIISVSTGNEMEWGNENEDRKAILARAKEKFIYMNEVNPTVTAPITTINIYAGTNENADLSNFAVRPFRHTFSDGSYKDFQSVEQAFQYIKAHQFADTRANDGIARGGKDIEAEIMETTNGARLRQLGKSIKGLNVSAWDRASSTIMKELLKESFEQNHQALQRLVSTGNATLTHIQDKGKWGTEFPKLLMEVREELRNNSVTAQAEVKETHTTLEKDLGGDDNAKAEIKDTIEVAKKGLTFEEAIKGQESFFTKEEQDEIKKGLNGKNLQVMSVSRQTDPAFFSKEIVKFLETNSKKPLSDPTRVNAIEIWSKHDGLPIKDILDACKKYRVAPMVSFSITGLGGTALEGGVMKYQDMLEKVGKLIENGTLNATTTTIRIDPILPGVTNMEDIKKIVATAKSFGIKKFVTSLVQSYGYLEGTTRDRKVISGINNALASENKTYDWDKYYGRDSKGKINFKPKQEYIDEIGKVLLKLDKDPEITIQTCAFIIKGLKASACLDPMILERVVGVDVINKDGSYDRDTSRKDCMCYGCHGDFFKGQNKKCYSSCAYCYASHSGDNKLNYYNEDGTLKDNIFTQTEYKNNSNSTTSTSTNNTSLSNVTVYNSNNLVDETPKTAVQRKEVKEIDKPNSEAVTSALEISKNEDREYHEAFSPRQISDLGEYFGKVFSRNLDALEGDRIDELNELLSDDSYTKKEKEEIRETLNKFEDPVKGRQLIVQEYGINNLINDVLKEVKGNIRDAEKYNNEDEFVLWTNTEKYFTKIFNEQATLNIEEAEGIRIVDLEVKEDTTDDPNNDEDDDDDTSQYADKEASGWLYKARYTDPASTLSKKVKRLFSYIEKKVLVIDKDGNGKYVTEKNSIGMPKYYSTSQVYATFLSYFSNNVKNPDSFMHICKTYDELVEAIGKDYVKEWVAEDEDEFKEDYPYGYPLFPALEEMEKQYPWVKGIIGELTNDFWKGNTYHTYGTLSSQMYSGLKLAFIPYDKYDKTAGRLRHLNHDMAEQVMLEKLKTNYYNGITLTNTSIYNSDGSINVENLKTLIKDGYGSVTTSVYVPTTEDDEETKNRFNRTASRYLKYIRSFGIDMDANAVVALMTTKRMSSLLMKLGYIQDVISKQIESGAKSADTFDYMVDVRHLKSDVNLWKDLFTGAGIITDDQYVQSFRDSATKKTKYSYSSDNYIMNTFRSIGMGSLEDRRAYIDEHYSKYEWFRNQKTGEWRNYWLDIFYNRGIDNLKGSVDEFLLPAYRNVDNIEDEKRGKPVVRKYTKWTAEDIFDIQQSGYDQKKSWAFYLAPIFSDSPMSLMIRGPKFTIGMLIEKHKDQILKGNRLVDVERRGAFVELVRQELVRIKYEVERQKAIKEGKILPIDNFDYGNALKFCFIPELNDYTINGMTLREAIANAQKDLATDDEIDDIIREYVKEVLEPNFIAYYSANMKDFDTISDFKKDQLRVRYYNMVYANASMIQLLTVDLAFYKNFIDFQKRWKEVYSGGNKPNTSSRFGKKTENVAILRDAIITSPSYSRVAAVDKNQSLSKEDKEHIKGIFKNVNVADAQAIRSLKSFRAVMDMLGKWSLAHDKALENFNNNNWNRADFDAIMNVIKPFLYGVIDTPDGLGNHIPMPVQHKNSEICALMMYSLIANSLNNSTVYRALSRFMDETVGSDGEPLIDMIEFESASKVCNQGVINISFSPEKVKNFIAHGFDTYGIKLDPIKDDNGKIIPVSGNTAETYYSYIKDSLDDMLDKGTINQDKYNKIMADLAPSEDEIISMLKSATTIVDKDGNTVINPQRVKTIPFDYYSESQHVPLHHEDAKVPHGSQARNLAVADVSDNTIIELKGKGEKQQFKGQDIVDFYYKLLNENLLEDYFGADGKGGLSEIFSSNESLAEAIKDVVRGNPKYDRGFMEALELHDGKFNLSLNSPTMFSAIQSIVTAFFRNRITKQKVDGATLVQAAGIGLNKDLRLKFDDNGKLIGLECYLPVTSKALFEPLLTTDAEGNTTLDPKKLEEFGLNEAAGYRIPTENKSSMAPLIIKGFTPIQNGSMIVLPAEITALAGSNFEIDRMFLILTSFDINRYDMDMAWHEFVRVNPIFDYITPSIYDKEQFTEDNFKELVPDKVVQKSFYDWFNGDSGQRTPFGNVILNKDRYLYKDKNGNPAPRINAVKYDFDKSPKENSRKARCNMILHLTNNVLRSKAGTEAFLNPQGFRDVEDAANLMRILHNFDDFMKSFTDYSDYSVVEFIDALIAAKSKTLAKYAEKYKASDSPIYPQTFAKLHAQNMAGVKQLGIYAIQASMSAKYQRADVRIKPHLQFVINGRTIDRADASNNGRVVKNTNQMVGASADNCKHPNLIDMGSTSTTNAAIIGTMLREGMTHKEAALTINQYFMSMPLYKLENRIKGSEKAYVTTKMLIHTLLDPMGSKGIASRDEILNVAKMCYDIRMQHTSMEFINNVSRADSPNGGMKNSYAGCRVQRYKVDVLQAMMGQDSFAYERIKETLSNDAVDVSSSEDHIREQLHNQKMGLLHGMYALGINSFDSLMGKYFFGSQKWFDDKVVKPILYNLPINSTFDNDAISTVNKIYKYYVIYRLSDSKLFGDDDKYTMEEKRKYYINKFPKKLREMIANNEEVRKLLGTIFTVQDNRIMFLNAGNMGKKQLAIARDRVAALRYSDNEEVRNLATQLLQYAYYDNGLQFSNTSITSAFSTDFLMSFPEYNRVLDNLNKEIDEKDTANFIYQYLNHNPEAAYTIPKDLIDYTVWDNATGDMLVFNNKKDTTKLLRNTILSPNPKADINMYPYVRAFGQLYVWDKEATESVGWTKLVYHRVPTYDHPENIPYFNSKLSVAELEEFYPKQTRCDSKSDGYIDYGMLYDDFDAALADIDFDDLDNAADAINSIADDILHDIIDDSELKEFDGFEIS